MTAPINPTCIALVSHKTPGHFFAFGYSTSAPFANSQPLTELGLNQRLGECHFLHFSPSWFPGFLVAWMPPFFPFSHLHLHLPPLPALLPLLALAPCFCLSMHSPKGVVLPLAQSKERLVRRSLNVHASVRECPAKLEATQGWVKHRNSQSPRSFCSLKPILDDYPYIERTKKRPPKGRSTIVS